MNCCSACDGLVGVDAAVGLLSVEALLQQLAHLGHASGTADKHDVVDGAPATSCDLLERLMMTRLTGSIVLRNTSMHSSSNLARVILQLGV